MDNEQLNEVVDESYFRLEDLLGVAEGLYRHDPETAKAPVFFHFDPANGSLTCTVRKGEWEEYTIFTNDKALPVPARQNFKVFVKPALSSKG